MKITLSILLSIISIALKADLGTSYCIKGTILTKDGGSYTGYFHHGADLFSIQNSEQGVSYYALGKEGLVNAQYDSGKNAFLINPKDESFFNDFLFSLSHTLDLHQDAVLIPFPEEGAVPAFRGWNRTILKKDITKVVISSITETSVLYHLRTPITQDDLFIYKPVIQKRYLGQPDCIYYAFHFSKPNAKTEELINSFYALVSDKEGDQPEANHENRERAVIQKLIELKQHHVLIIFTCSC